MIKKIVRGLFLAKEIVAQDGTLVFRRWRVVQLPWFRVYVHQLFESDRDAHLHSHPWHFVSYILKGGYIEESLPANPETTTTTVSQRLRVVLKGCWSGHKADEFHRLSLLDKPTTTLFIAYGKAREWGYYVPEQLGPNKVVSNEQYRKLKHQWSH